MRHKGRFHTPPHRHAALSRHSVVLSVGVALVVNGVVRWLLKTLRYPLGGRVLRCCAAAQSRVGFAAVALECVALQGAECVQGVPP